MSCPHLCYIGFSICFHTFVVELAYHSQFSCAVSRPKPTVPVVITVQVSVCVYNAIKISETYNE